MDRLVTIKTVQDAIAQIENNGDTVTQRKIRMALGGGSPNEINQIYREIEEANSIGIDLPRDLPPTLASTLMKEINNRVLESAGTLQEEVARARREMADAIDDLTRSEEQRSRLDLKLTEARNQAEDYRQKAEKESAVNAEQIENLNKQVAELKQERQRLIESGEVARIAAAKTQEHVERSDQAAQKAEGQTEGLRAQLKDQQEAFNQASIQRQAVIDSLRSQFSDAKSTSAVAGAKVENLERLILEQREDLKLERQQQDTLRNERHEMRLKIESSEIEIKRLRADHDQGRDDLQLANRSMMSLQGDYVELERSHAEMNHHYRSISDDNQKLQQEISQLKQGGQQD